MAVSSLTREFVTPDETNQRVLSALTHTKTLPEFLKSWNRRRYMKQNVI
jgi:hypothetical protein